MELSEIEQLLNDPTVENRLQAARELSRLEGFQQVLFLIALGDEDWRVRKEAIGYFLQQPNAISRASLIIEQLSHPENAGLRNAAIEILIALGAQAAKLLLDEMAVADAEVRKFIVDILGEIACPSCAEELLKYLRDEDENVRYAVVETLGKLGSVDAVDALLELLEEADAGLQFTIFEALTSIGEGVPVAKLLPYAESNLLRKSVFSCFGELGDPEAIPALLQGLSDPMRKTREVALLSFGRLIRRLPHKDCPQVGPQTEQVIDYLFACLEHEKKEFRRAACYVLSLFPDSEVVSRLLPLLADEELRDDVVASAQLIPKAIFNALLQGIGLEDENALYLIYLLGELGCPEIAALAEEGLQSENPQFRYASIITLGKIGHLASIDAIGDGLEDSIAEIREAAAEALIRVGRQEPQAVIRTVTPYLESPESELRLLAVRILGGLPAEKVENHLLLALKDVVSGVRCEALRGLAGHQSQRLLSGLSLALTDEVADVRRLAAVAIGAFPAQRSTPILLHALEDPDPWVRMEAVRALSPGQETDLQEMVARAANDPVGLVVIALLENVQRLLPGAAESYLRRALEHEDREVVATAVRLLCGTHAEQLLADPREQVRLLTVNELCRDFQPQHQQLFEDRLLQETDAQVRQAIEEALRKGLAGG